MDKIIFYLVNSVGYIKAIYSSASELVRMFAHYVVFQKHKFHVDEWVSLFIDKRCMLLSGKMWNFPLKLVISEVLCWAMPFSCLTLSISQIIRVFNKMGW